MKEEREFYFPKNALAAYADFHKSEPTLSESPDFIFYRGSKLFGIEITDYGRPPTKSRHANPQRPQSSDEQNVAHDSRFLSQRPKTATL